MLYRQFSNIIIYIRDVGKLPEEQFSVSFFFSPGGKILKRWKTTGQIFPLLSTRIRIFPPGLENIDRLKCWSGNIPTSLIYVIMLENFRNNISIYCCSPIQEERSWFFLKFIEVKISECNMWDVQIHPQISKHFCKIFWKCSTEVCSNGWSLKPQYWEYWG